MAKTIRHLLFLSLISISVHSQPTILSIGDTIHAYMRQHLVTHKVPSADISNWVEGKHIILYTYQSGADSARPVFLSSREIPFGVLQGVPPNAYFLFDTDGDGALDYRTENPLVPLWLVSHTSRAVQDPHSTQFSDLLDAFFDAFQSEKGLGGSTATISSYLLLAQSATDTSIPNRDLLYDFWYYTKFTQEDPRQALLAMEILDHFYTERFGRTHPLISLYKLESSIQIGDKEMARTFLDQLMDARPDFIPGQYYRCILDADTSRGAAQFVELKHKYPNHWLIKSAAN